MTERAQITFENPREYDNQMTLTWTGEDLTVEVEELHALDSYNSLFNCSISLSRSEAIRLREFLKTLPI